MSTSANLGDSVTAALDEAIVRRGKVNILLAGKTGVGKSTLINTVFQGNFARTGQGRPVTTHTREIHKPGFPLTLLDTRGLETARFDETFSQLRDLVASRSSEPDPADHIHVAWLCIHEDGRRVEDAEVRLHEMLSEFMPVVVVVTKARFDDGFRAEVQRLLPKAVAVVRVRALQEHYDDGHVAPPFGLEDLIEVTNDAIPRGQQMAFIAVQRTSVKQKRREAMKIVAASAAAASGAGAVPVPFADAIVLAPIQVTMLAGVTAAFGIDMTLGSVAALVASLAGVVGATYGGRALTAGLLKLIPGVGTGIGAVLGGAVAGAVTTALGSVYVETLAYLVEKDGMEALTEQTIVTEFKRRYAGA